MTNELVQIITTIDSKEIMEDLANGLLKSKLAACVQVEQITSMYHWKNDIANDDEFRITIKTTPNLMNDVTNYIDKHHTYEVPEILVVKGNVNSSYFNWVQEVTSQTIK